MPRLIKRIARSYRQHCAREDARVRNIVTPLGVWVCEHCRHVSLDLTGFTMHAVEAHA
jgi:ribosomal protein L37AE/L43A